MGKGKKAGGGKAQGAQGSKRGGKSPHGGGGRPPVVPRRSSRNQADNKSQGSPAAPKASAAEGLVALRQARPPTQGDRAGDGSSTPRAKRKSSPALGHWSSERKRSRGQDTNTGSARTGDPPRDAQTTPSGAGGRPNTRSASPSGKVDSASHSGDGGSSPAAQSGRGRGGASGKKDGAVTDRSKVGAVGREQQYLCRQQATACGSSEAMVKRKGGGGVSRCPRPLLCLGSCCPQSFV